MERRRHPRYAITANVSFRSENNFFSGRTRNISEGGLYIESEDVPSIGNRISVDLTFFGVHAVVTGEVMWISYDSSRTPRGFGVQFVDLEPKTARSIEKFMRLRAPVELELELSQGSGPPPLPSKRTS